MFASSGGGEDGRVEDDKILDQWARRAHLMSPVTAPDAVRGWHDMESGLVPRRAEDGWHVDIDNRGTSLTEAILPTEADAKRYLLLSLGRRWRLESHLGDCFSTNPASGSVVVKDGPRFSVLAGGRLAFIRHRPTAYQYTQIVDLPLSTISARLLA